MKKLLCLALVLAMALSLVPTSFAAPQKTVSTEEMMSSFDFPKSEYQMPAMSDPFNSKVVSQASSLDTARVYSRNELNSIMSVGLSDSNNLGVAYIDPEQSATTGYLMSNIASDGDNNVFLEITDDNLFHGTAYGCFITPMFDTSANHAKGDRGYIYAPCFESLSRNGNELTPNYFTTTTEVRAMVLIGRNDEDDMYVYEEVVGNNGVSVDYTIPEDNMYVMVLLLIYTKGNCATFVTPSTFETRWDELNTARESTPMKLDTEYKVELDGDTIDILNPFYLISTAKVFSLEAEADTFYAPRLDGTNNVGYILMCLNDKGQVIFSGYATSQEIASGDKEYDDQVLPLRIAEAGTYYFVVSGMDLGDVKGELTFKVLSSENSQMNLTRDEVDIDLKDFANKNMKDEENGYWQYQYQADIDLGVLWLAPAGIFNIKGENNKVALYINPYSTINLDNVTCNGFALANDWSPVDVNLTGVNTLSGNLENKITNVATETGGSKVMNEIIIRGDTLKIEGVRGIMLEDYHISFYMQKLTIDVNTPDNYIPVTFWGWGHYAKEPRLGKNAKFGSPAMKLMPIHYNEAPFDVALFGYTFGEDDFLCYYGDPNINQSPESVDYTSDGQGGGASVMKGDVNGNGKVDTGDAAAILQSAVGLIELTDAQRAAADFDDSGAINTGDATQVLRAAVGL